jgi:hypothetical protein
MRSSNPSVPLVGREEARPPAVRTRHAAARLVLIAGSAFALVGIADLALLWLPARAGNVAWEYATVGRTLDSMPMVALGLVLIGYGVLRASRPTVNGVRLVAAVFFVFGLLCAFLAFLLLTSAPAVLSRTPPDAIEAMRRAATRHSLQSILYPLAWFAIAIVVWRARTTEGIS